MSEEKNELTRKEFLTLSAAAGAALVASAGTAHAARAKKPHWVMVMT